MRGQVSVGDETSQNHISGAKRREVGQADGRRWRKMRRCRVKGDLSLPSSLVLVPSTAAPEAWNWGGNEGYGLDGTASGPQRKS